MENDTKTSELTPEASLGVILQMIESTRNSIGRNYFYFLFWGYLVAFTGLLEFALIKWVAYPKHYLVWPILMGTGTIVSFIFAFMQNRKSKSRTFIGSAMGYLWLGWMISFFILLFFMIYGRDFRMILPLCLAMYGLAIFVSAGLISFKPLFVGAIIVWAGAIAAFFSGYSIQLIIVVTVVVFSHIIPGHMLKNMSKQ